MDTYIPDKPIIIEVIEEEEKVPYTLIRYFTGTVILLTILLSVWITLLTVSISYTYGKGSIGYLFIPVMISFVFKAPIFKILLLIELSIFLASITLTVLNSKTGILGDFAKESKEILTFSELFMLGMALSIIIILLLGSPQNGGIPDIKNLHVVILDAPFYEEITFRFIWLLWPSIILSSFFANNKVREDPDSSKGFLGRFIKFTLKGKGKLYGYDYLLIIASALFFGLSHFVIVSLDLSTLKISVEFSWGAWKIVQASMIGIIMGYLALKGGLPASLTFHWLINTLAVGSLLLRDPILLFTLAFLYLIIIIGGIIIIAFVIVRFVHS